MNTEKNAKMICWDMDGTMASLYGVDNWLSKLRAEDPSPYEDAAPMWDMELLNYVCELLRAAGWEINIITWLSKNSKRWIYRLEPLKKLLLSQ